MPFRSGASLLSLILVTFALSGAGCETSPLPPLTPVPYGKVVKLDDYKGQSLTEVFRRFGQVTTMERTYRASTASGEFRAAVIKQYPPNDPASHEVIIREIWWLQARTYYSFFFHRIGTTWLVLDASKWRGHTQFANQPRIFPTN